MLWVRGKVLFPIYFSLEIFHSCYGLFAPECWCLVRVYFFLHFLQGLAGMCLFSVGRGVIVTGVVLTLWLLFLKKEEFPRRSGDVVRGIHLICPHSFRVFLSSWGGVLTIVQTGDWHSYLLFLAAFERSQKWWFPLVISHVDHIKAMARHGAGLQPIASIEDSPHRLCVTGNSFSWVKVHIFPLELGSHLFQRLNDARQRPEVCPVWGSRAVLALLRRWAAVRDALTLGVALGLAYGVKESAWI